MMKHVRVAMTIMLVALLSATLGYPQPEPPPPPSATEQLREEWLKFKYHFARMLDGSTSTQPLNAWFTARVLGLEPVRVLPVGYCHPVFDGQPLGRNITIMAPEPGQPLPVPKAVEHFQKALLHLGTHDSYCKLIEGEVELILVAREPSESELKLAGEERVELDVRPIALDAFVFLLHADNPVEGLTSDQIRDIYTGKVENWDEVGGPDEPITAYQRDQNSGSQELMEKLVMGDLEMIDAPNMVLRGMGGPINALPRNRQGLGYSVYYYVMFMTSMYGIQLCAVDGVMPTSETIASREYPYTTEVYAVVRKDLAERHLAYKVRDWLLTPEGQALVAESGYVPIGSPPVAP